MVLLFPTAKTSFWSYHQIGNLLFTETVLTRWQHTLKFIYILSHNRNGEEKKEKETHITHTEQVPACPQCHPHLENFLDKDFAVFLFRGGGIGRRVSLINTTFLKINIFSDIAELLKHHALAAGQMEADLPMNSEPAAIDGAAHLISPPQQRASNLTLKG